MQEAGRTHQDSQGTKAQRNARMSFVQDGVPALKLILLYQAFMFYYKFA